MVAVGHAVLLGIETADVSDDVEEAPEDEDGESDQHSRPGEEAYGLL